MNKYLPLKTIFLAATITVYAIAPKASATQAQLQPNHESCTALFQASQLKQAINVCQTEAEEGSSIAAETLARMYFGQGELNNQAKAFEWAKIASERGSASSQALLGLMYLRGDGVEKNTEKAQHYIQLAIDNGNKGAKELRKLMKRAGLWKKTS